MSSVSSRSEYLLSLIGEFIHSVLCFYTVFASYVARDFCELYTVIRTDHSTDPWTREVQLTYPPSDFMSAVRRAEYYQQTFDPHRTRYDYRVHMCS